MAIVKVDVPQDQVNYNSNCPICVSPNRDTYNLLLRRNVQPSVILQYILVHFKETPKIEELKEHGSNHISRDKNLLPDIQMDLALKELKRQAVKGRLTPIDVEQVIAMTINKFGLILESMEGKGKTANDVYLSFSAELRKLAQLYKEVNKEAGGQGRFDQSQVYDAIRYLSTLFRETLVEVIPDWETYEPAFKNVWRKKIIQWKEEMKNRMTPDFVQDIEPEKDIS